MKPLKTLFASFATFTLSVVLVVFIAAPPSSAKLSLREQLHHAHRDLDYLLKLCTDDTSLVRWEPFQDAVIMTWHDCPSDDPRYPDLMVVVSYAKVLSGGDLSEDSLKGLGRAPEYFALFGQVEDPFSMWPSKWKRPWQRLGRWAVRCATPL